MAEVFQYLQLNVQEKCQKNTKELLPIVTKILFILKGNHHDFCRAIATMVV